ncbi:MAG: hypothetical protein JNK19_15050, partial [Tabrizicola sp.]|nr:hypothetical protein [Tabrizicola sp.]
MNRTTGPALIACLLSAGVLVTSGAALAETVIKVSLWDKGETAMDNVGKHTPIGMAVEGADPTMATMGVTLDLQEVPAGEFTFKITNDSGEFYHAVLVSPV